MRGATLVTEDELVALEPEWRRLESRMIQLPFVCCDWVIPWWRHFQAQWNAASLSGLPGGYGALEARINGTFVSRFL